MAATPLPIAVLISGGGTTLRNLLEKIDARTLRAEVCTVVSSNESAGGLEYARDAGIPIHLAPKPRAIAASGYSRAVFDPCRAAGAKLVVMGGFLKHVAIPPDFENRVMNIHPGLIPAFCGKGFYGLRVHQAVLDYGAKISGCTVHFVDDEYDHGPIILQRVVDVRDDDTAERLARRVFEQECVALPEAVQLFADDRIVVEGRRVRIL